MTAPLDVGSIEALLAKATPGPWSTDREYFVAEIPNGRPGGEVIGSSGASASVHRDLVRDVANTAAIVALRNAAPALLAAARECGEVKALLREARRFVMPHPTTNDNGYMAGLVARIDASLKAGAGGG